MLPRLGYGMHTSASLALSKSSPHPSGEEKGDDAGQILNGLTSVHSVAPLGKLSANAG